MGDLKPVEALRGLAAIGLAMQSWLWALGMSGSPPAANLHLLYDLFFVISGFVIAQVYRARLISTREAARYALLRFGRVYPLHLTVLMILLALQTVGFGAGPAGEPGSLAGFVANLAMLQGVGLVEPGAWNAPAWFISAEFALSMLFAALCLADIPRGGAGLGAIALCVAWALWTLAGSPDGLPTGGPEALLRGFAGFLLGVLAQAASRNADAIRPFQEMGRLRATLWEAGTLALVAGMILCAPPQIQALSPPVAAAMVFIASAARGWLRAALVSAPVQALARLSFGVFMCHWLLVGPLHAAMSNGGRLGLGVTPTELVALGGPFYLLAVIGLAALAERWVERPTRQAMRAWIERRSRGYSAARPRSDVV